MSSSTANTPSAATTVQGAGGIDTLPHLKNSTAPASSKRPNPAEEWQMNRAAIHRYSKAGNWQEAFKLLTVLSTKHKNKEIYKALAQRVWIALKTETPVPDVVLALFHLFNTLGPRHNLAGPIAALAHLMAKHRTPEHPDRGLALGQAQQMFALVCDQAGVVGEEAFKIWVRHHQLDHPDHYIPMVMHGLELMVGEAWWIDRDGLQKEMETARAKKS